MASFTLVAPAPSVYRLHQAIRRREHPMVDLMLQQGVSPNAPNAQGMTAMHIAIDGRTFRLVAAYAPHMYGCVARNLQRFPPALYSLSDQHKQKVHEALSMATKVRSVRAWASRVRSGELTIVPAGWYEHSIAVVFFRHWMAICNRGQGCPKGSNTIAVFPINVSQVTLRTIREMFEQEHKSCTEGSLLLTRHSKG